MYLTESDRVISLLYAWNKLYSTYPIHIKSQQKSAFAKRYCVNATLQRRPQFNVKEGMWLNVYVFEFAWAILQLWFSLQTLQQSYLLLQKYHLELKLFRLFVSNKLFIFPIILKKSYSMILIHNLHIFSIDNRRILFQAIKAHSGSLEQNVKARYVIASFPF